VEPFGGAIAIFLEVKGIVSRLSAVICFAMWFLSIACYFSTEILLMFVLELIILACT